LVGLGSSSEGKRSRILAALEHDIDYCLSILKMDDHHEETERTVKELCTQNISCFGIYQERLIALKIIADFVTLTSNVLSQSQLYDFLMLSAAAVSAEEMRGPHKRPQGANDIVFKIYRDLMENYETASYMLKLNYPRIIVDVVAVLNNGMDMSGKQVSFYQIYDYYLSRKSQPISDIAGVNISDIVSGKDKKRTEHDGSKDDLIESLVRITGRNSNKIEELLGSLSNSDIEKIRNLCVNYPKIDKYCKLVASDRKRFIDEIEKEHGGKKLTKYQLQIAVMSITKVRRYIENVLDRKFVTHTSHYINHTKHNLEYGYQVMGLIESGKRARKEETSTSKS
jgi:hypothetical protein